jgi:hypothetical protein
MAWTTDGTVPVDRELGPNCNPSMESPLFYHICQVWQEGPWSYWGMPVIAPLAHSPDRADCAIMRQSLER